MAFQIRNISRVQAKARRHGVQKLGENVYRVTSCISDKRYVVNLRYKSCTCDRQPYIGERNGYVNACSHVQAAMIAQWLERGYHLVARGEQEDVGHLKRRLVFVTRDGDVVDENGEPVDEKDGVKFTARAIEKEKAERKLVEKQKARQVADSHLDEVAKINRELFGWA